MNLTPQERAAMVKDLQALEAQYSGKAGIELFNSGRTQKYDHLARMASNYESLASALKEGLKFNEVA